MGLFDELAEDAEKIELGAVPTDQQMTALRDKCRELVDADAAVRKLEADLEAAKKKHLALAHKELPELFGKFHIDNFGIPDAGEFGVDLKLTPYFKANILSEWPEDQKEAAFDHLEALGGGDIVKTEVKFTLGRGQTELARTIVAMIRTLGEAMEVEGVRDIPSPSVSMGVPWNSLTSFVKERHTYEGSDVFRSLVEQAEENGDEPPISMDLTILNATVGEVVKIKERKK